MNDTTLAWHFVGSALRDGRPVPPDGEWLEHRGPIHICRSGLHASHEPYDALGYAPGNILCRVKLQGIAAAQADKLVGRRRCIIKRVDMTEHFRRFARKCALDGIHLWDAPPVVREYLAAGDLSLRAAAYDAATAAADDAATAAAYAAVAYAAAYIAYDAAAGAAAYAAGAAADDDAAYTGRGTHAAYRNKFNTMVYELFEV